MNRTYLRQLLTLNIHRLLITAEGLSSAMIEAFPLVSADSLQPTSFFFNENPPTYKETSKKALSLLQQEMKARSELQGITVTDDFYSDELPEGSIAYHRIWGFITSDCQWYFSSKQFERDLLAAEANPAITCHFLHVNSPGGEAWYMDRLSETMRSLGKPVMTLVEQCNCSASYYITCHSSFIAALTAYDTIGCIGTMISTCNPEQYIKEELDPPNEQFLAAVLASRPQLGNLPEDDPVFRGETFDTPHAIDKGLVDASMTFPEAVAKAVELGRSYMEIENIKRSALNYL